MIFVLIFYSNNAIQKHVHVSTDVLSEIVYHLGLIGWLFIKL